MKEKIVNDYIVKGKIDIDKVLDDFYGYVYIIVKNTISIYITEQDMEEIISDVFIAIWKNSSKISKQTPLKPYLAGIAKNRIKNKYRKTEVNFSILDYEEKLVDKMDIEKITEENEQNNIIKNVLNTLKVEEYQIFIMFYYEAKAIKEIAKILNCSESKVKIILYRVRKIIKRKLEDGGYSYGK